MHNETRPLVRAGRDNVPTADDVPETPNVHPVVRDGKRISGLEKDSANDALCPYSNGSASADIRGQPPPSNGGISQADYWHALINEKVGADFADVTARTLQSWRQKGNGPPYIQISARCIRYRRIDIKRWLDARIRNSTAEAA